MNRLRSKFEAGILVERAQQKERILRFDAELFDFDFVVGADAVAREQGMHVGRSFLFGGKEAIAEFLLEIAMQIEFGSARIDHDFGGVVVEKEWHVHALGGNLYPLAASAAAFPFPDESAVEVTRALGYWRDQGVGSDGKAAKFDHTHRCAANF